MGGKLVVPCTYGAPHPLCAFYATHLSISQKSPISHGKKKKTLSKRGAIYNMMEKQGKTGQASIIFDHHNVIGNAKLAVENRVPPGPSCMLLTLSNILAISC